MSVLQINGLTKRYRQIIAVNELDLEVPKGSVFGILGPNGSGKTTTLGIILDIIRQDAGHYTWFEGQYGSKARLKIGALLETPNFYPYLNAVDNLKITAHIKRTDTSQFDELLELVNLHHRRFSNFRTYSLGMKQRLAIAAALVGDPEVLIFDEPTNGLDPQGIAEVRSTILQIAATGKTIIMASHILDEVEKTCSHVGIIKNGKLLASGTVGAILSDDITIEISTEQSLSQLRELLTSHPNIRGIETLKDKLILSADPALSTATLNRLAFEKGITLSLLQSRQRSLESEFLEITK